MVKLIEFFINRSLFVNLLSAIIIITGMIVLVNIRKEAFPFVYLDQMIVETTYPGASPKEIEELVTVPIERALKEVDGIDEIRSLSAEGYSKIIVEIDEDAKDKERIKNEIGRAVDRVQEMPDEAEDPIVTEMTTSQQPIIEVSLSGLPERLLHDTANFFEDHLETIEGLASIEKRGYRKKEIWVELDPQKMADFRVSFDQVTDTLKLRNKEFPGGLLEKQSTEYALKTTGKFSLKQDVAQTVLQANPSGYKTRVHDIADVKDAFEEELVIGKTNGERSINLIILKKETGDTIKIVEEIKRRVEAIRPQLNPNLKIEYINDVSFYIKRRLNVLINNSWMGLLLVIGVLLLILSPRISIITALGIPIALFMSFITLSRAGISINLLSMFGLIIVLGMLVDDSIIFAENIFRHMELGLPPRRAALVGTVEVVKPVLAMVLTTIAAFLPLSFMSGIIGKFIWQIPAVVVVALLASLLEAMFALPSHCAAFAKPKTVKALSQKEHWLKPFYAWYGRGLEKWLRFRYAILGATLVLFGISVWLGLQVIPFDLFPPRGVEIFIVRVQAAPGTSVKQMSKRMESLEAPIKALPKEEVENFTSYAGITIKDPSDPYAQIKSHVGQMVVYLTPETKRKRKAEEIIAEIREKTASVGGFERIFFERVKPGPPVGKPLTIQILGDDFETLGKIAHHVEEVLAGIRGVKDIDHDHQPGKPELHVVPHQEAVAHVGLTFGQVAKTVRSAFEGNVATTIKEPDEDVKIRVKFAGNGEREFAALQNLKVATPTGSLVPLSEIAELKTAPGVADVRRLDLKRAITVTAEVENKNMTPERANQFAAEKLENFMKGYPGYFLKFGGEKEKTDESLRSLFRAFMVAVLVILLILATTFSSLSQPLIVMITIPFGFIGVALAFLLHQLPLSFMALLGMVGLSGVVVNDAIVLVDFINHLRKEGYSPFQAAVEAGKLRIRPILLTTVTTVFGLAPTAYGLGGKDPFLVPAALAISWGLIFSTLLTLVVTPCSYLILEDLKARFRKDRD